MSNSSRPILAAMAAALLSVATAGTASAEPVRVAFGDIPSVENLNLLIALERAKERGLEIETSFLKSEDIAAQAVVGGQADIGVGTPYALIQKARAPVRLFLQLALLRFYPVVATEFYDDWKDLDGQEIVVHSRGSGTEAIMKLMAKRHGIEYASISYVPGSEVRATAMLQGTIKATIVDAVNRRILLEKGGDRFRVLPMEGVDASDEALFANRDVLDSRMDDVVVLVEEVLRTWREIAANPEVVAELRTRYGLLPDLPAELEAEIVPYYREAVEAGVLPLNGGSEEAARTDLEFYAIAGQLEGDPASLDVADFWDFRPLEKALANLGRM